MKQSSGSRTSAELSRSVNHQLNAYALAATAAGVGLVALSHPAEARIVYTPAHVRVVVGSPTPLDLNHDGTIDFYLLRYFERSSGNAQWLSACQHLLYYDGTICLSYGTNGMRAARFSTGWNFVLALRSGAKIQRGDRFQPADPLGGLAGFRSGTSSTYWFGPWVNGGKGVKNRYLGLKFRIKGEFHFGWARVTVKTTKNDFSATLTGYAYETIPGKAIIAGQTQGPDVITVPPGSLGSLALGRK